VFGNFPRPPPPPPVVCLVLSGFDDALEPGKAAVVDGTLMQLPPLRCFYRMIAYNESGRSQVW
jgi:hypothetical protein